MSDEEYQEIMELTYLTSSLMDNKSNAHQKRWDNLLSDPRAVERMLGRDQEETLQETDQTPLFIRQPAQTPLADLEQQTGVSVEVMQQLRKNPPENAHLNEPDIIWLPTIFHAVAPGETPELIAEAYSTTVDELKKWNSDLFFQDKLPQPGSVIKIIDREASLSKSNEHPDGIPEPLKGQLESENNVDLSDVEVIRDSNKPAEYGTEAFSANKKIHLAPGKEDHLEHEARHEVQKKQGKVKATGKLKDGTPVNTDPELEKDADKNNPTAANPVTSGQLTKAELPQAKPDASADKQAQDKEGKTDKSPNKDSKKSSAKGKPGSKSKQKGNDKEEGGISEKTDKATSNAPAETSGTPGGQSTTESSGNESGAEGLASPEYIKFKTTVAQQTQQLREAHGQRKQNLQSKGAAAKVAIATGIDAQIARSEANYAQATQHIKANAEACKAEIIANRDARIASIDEQTNSKIAELEEKTNACKNDLIDAGTAKAEAILAIGEAEAQRALAVTQSNKLRIQNLSNQKARTIRNEGGSDDEIQGFIDNNNALINDLQNSGEQIASIARRDAKEAADKFKSEAQEMVPEFEKTQQEVIGKIQEESEAARENLHEISSKTIDRLNEISQGLLSQLASTRSQQTPLLQQLGTGAGASIDEAIATAHTNLDTQTQTQIEEIETFAAKFDVAGGHGKIFGEMEADIVERATAFNQKMDEYGGNIDEQIGGLVSQVVQEATGQIDIQEERMQALLTNYDKETTKLSQKADTQSQEIVTGHASRIDEMMQHLTDGFQKSIAEAETKWDEELTEYQNQITQKVSQALEDQNESVNDFVRDLENEINKTQQNTDNNEVIQGFFSWLTNAIFSFFDGLWGIFMGLWKAFKGIFIAIWEAIKTPLFWIIVAVAAVLIIVAAIVLTIVTGGAFLVALVAVVTVVAKALLIIGAIIGGISALYFFYLAFTTKGLTARERGELIGRALFEVILVALDVTVFVKAVKWIGWLGKFNQIADKVGNINMAIKLMSKADDIESLIKIMNYTNDAGTILKLLKGTKDTQRILRMFQQLENAHKLPLLLKRVENSKVLFKLLENVKDAEKILQLLNRTKDAKTLLKLLKKADDLEALSKLLYQVKNTEKLLQMLDRAKDPKQLLDLLKKANDAEALSKLLYRVKDTEKLLLMLEKAKDADKLLTLLGKVNNTDELIVLLDKVKDVDKLITLLDRIKDTNKLQEFLNEANNADELIAILTRFKNTQKFDEHAIKGMTDFQRKILFYLEKEQGVYRGTKIRTADESKFTEIDRINIAEKWLLEDKIAQGFDNPMNPNPLASIKKWAKKQIYQKTKNRIEFIRDKADHAFYDGKTVDASPHLPEVTDLQKIRTYKFKLTTEKSKLWYGDLKTEINSQLTKLRTEFPDWTFEINL